MDKQQPISWAGPISSCDSCDASLMNNGKVFYDCKTKIGGAWGNLCTDCFLRMSFFEGKLGIGQGQKYEYFTAEEANKFFAHRYIHPNTKHLVPLPAGWYQTAGGSGLAPQR